MKGFPNIWFNGPGLATSFPGLIANVGQCASLGADPTKGNVPDDRIVALRRQWQRGPIRDRGALFGKFVCLSVSNAYEVDPGAHVLGGVESGGRVSPPSIEGNNSMLFQNILQYVFIRVHGTLDMFTGLSSKVAQSHSAAVGSEACVEIPCNNQLVPAGQLRQGGIQQGEPLSAGGTSDMISVKSMLICTNNVKRALR